MSYIKMKSSEVRDLCQKTIDWIDAERVKSRRAWIDARIEKSRRSWVRRLFGRPVMTEEKAFKELIGLFLDGGLVGRFAYNEVLFPHSGCMEVAKRLLEACGRGKEMLVDVRDLERIALWCATGVTEC
jgi:hypothetical protein